jgi:hypothetical protein
MYGKVSDGRPSKPDGPWMYGKVAGGPWMYGKVAGGPWMYAIINGRAACTLVRQVTRHGPQSA